VCRCCRLLTMRRARARLRCELRRRLRTIGARSRRAEDELGGATAVCEPAGLQLLRSGCWGCMWVQLRMRAWLPVLISAADTRAAGVRGEGVSGGPVMW
jgi:hypothetical protein